jgi:hypothetical protein
MSRVVAMPHSYGFVALPTPPLFTLKPSCRKIRRRKFKILLRLPARKLNSFIICHSHRLSFRLQVTTYVYQHQLTKGLLYTRIPETPLKFQYLHMI